MFPLLLSSLALGQDQVSLQLQDQELGPPQVGLRGSLSAGTAGTIGLGFDARVHSLGSVGPKWLYVHAGVSVAPYRPKLVGNETGWRLPLALGEVRVGAVRAKASDHTYSLELSRESSGLETEVTYTEYQAPHWNTTGVYVAVAGSVGSLLSAAPGVGLMWGGGSGVRASAEGYPSVSLAQGRVRSLTLYVAPSAIETLPVVPGLYWEQQQWSMSQKRSSMGTYGLIGVGVIPTRMSDEDIEAPGNVSYVPMPTLRLQIGWTGGVRR